MNADIGLLHLWNQGDFVTRAVAVILLAMSLSSWIVILVKALDLQRHARQSRSIESFWHASTSRTCTPISSPVRASPRTVTPRWSR